MCNLWHLVEKNKFLGVYYEFKKIVLVFVTSFNCNVTSIGVAVVGEYP